MKIVKKCVSLLFLASCCGLLLFIIGLMINEIVMWIGLGLFIIPLVISLTSILITVSIEMDRDHPSYITIV